MYLLHLFVLRCIVCSLCMSFYQLLLVLVCFNLFLLVAFVKFLFLAEFHVSIFFDLLGVEHWLGIMVGVGLSGCVRVVFLGGDGFALAAFFLVGLSPFCVDNQCVFKYIHHLITFSVSHMLGSHF